MISSSVFAASQLNRNRFGVIKFNQHGTAYSFGYSGFFCEEVFTTEAPSSQRSENFLIKNSLLRALSASALKIVADPSFGGSAVQSPSPASQECLKPHSFFGSR